MNLNINMSQQIYQEPFFHVVLDDVFPPEELSKVLDEWPGPDDDADWGFHDQPQEQKGGWGGWRRDSRTQWPCPVTRDVLDTMVSDTFVQFLTRLTGIRGLIVDPLLEGGGAHEIRPGGYLYAHIDFTKHPSRMGSRGVNTWNESGGVVGEDFRLDRRLNAILYLNKDWKPEYNGYLELWSSERTGYLSYVRGTEHVSYEPKFNRMVVFPTNQRSFHGHPADLACPEGMTRKSLAVYYYTDGRPDEEETEMHSTVFMDTL